MASNTPKIVKTPPDKLVCQICHRVAHIPYKVTCCRRIYCEACLNESKRPSKACPNCEQKPLKVMCSNNENGCDWVGNLQSLGNHLKNDCPNREDSCPHCKDIGRYCDITTTHLDTCPKVKVSCPNTDCKASVPRCDLSAHRSTCEFEKVPCTFAEIGCEEEPLRKDLQQHENDDAFHLHLVIKTVNELQKKMKLVGDNVATCPCVFKMPQYHQHKSSKQEWYSPPFYTHPGGYKICLAVDANGYDKSAGNHVSVYAYLMKGKNDDNLLWPFTGKVTVTLLNQLEDKNHHKYRVSFPEDDEASRRVVDGEMAPRGYGKQLFIPHDKLKVDSDKVQYLMDDCLFFKIKTKARPVKSWLTCTV